MSTSTTGTSTTGTSTTGTRIDEALVRALPKAEVHVHLEGGFSLVDLMELSKAAGEELPGPAATIFDVSTHDGLGGFLDFLDWECGLVRTPEQAARHAYSFAARETSSGVRYADVIVNPTHWNAWAGRVPHLLDAFAAGFDEAEQDGLAVVNLCVSLLRQQSAGEAVELVELLAEHRPARVVALSVDGDEAAAGRTGEKFAQAFTLARDRGFHRTVHAGESSGPEGVWDAVRLLHAERVDHGVRAAEDPALIEHLVREGISLGVCPRSNLALGVYRDWVDHPLEALREAGVRVTLNTDDPAPLGTTLEADWAVAAGVFGWDLGVLRDFARTSVEVSFAPPELKAALLGELGS
ncbi:adenosine deaminase [Kineococcus rhizosphaerae]|uniref:Adenosine deaminase n=1 Tax=Kineococcus rhizosphaerae TaxID=559628 RepID=A0A2T0R7W2_9ACTN|nr:adenosine deaminase [Kineococcus rhizosphaerae]PRY17230.1 adenosine deaminase [Kineococcus rhizosphaerae]